MIKNRFLVAAAAGTFFYVLISFMGGRDGLLAYKQQLEQKRILSTRTESLQKTHDSLSLECTALENDNAVIQGLAKKLGYVSDGDKIVKINGLYFSDGAVYTCGTPIRAAEPQYLPEWVGKSVGVIVFLFLYLFMIAQDIKAGHLRRNKKTVFLEGVPVYDLPQI